MIINYFEYKKLDLDYELNKEKVFREKVVLKIIRLKDGMMVLIYGLFYNLGINREFKVNFIKMFNLSDKVSIIKVENGFGLVVIFDFDEEKLSFSDFLVFFLVFLSVD